MTLFSRGQAIGVMLTFPPRASSALQRRTIKPPTTSLDTPNLDGVAEPHAPLELTVPIDDVAALAPHHVVEEGEVPTSRPRGVTLSPSIEADVRLIRNAVDQQGQLLALLHTMLVDGQTHVSAELQKFRDELTSQTVKIDNIAEMLAAINKHLGINQPA